MPKVTNIYLLDFGIIVSNTCFNYSDELSYIRMINNLGSKTNIRCYLYNLDKSYGVKDVSLKRIKYTFDKIKVIMDRKTKFKLLDSQSINEPCQILSVIEKLPKTQQSQIMEIL